MKQTKIYRALSELSIYELNRFQKFANSPYFNKSKAIIDLTEYFIKSIKSDSDSQKEHEKTSIWEKIYPDKKFSDVKYRKLLSDTLKLFESFIIYEEFEKSPLNKASLLLQGVKEKNLKNLYNSSLSTAKRLSNQQTDQSANFYFHQYQIEKNEFSMVSEFERKRLSKSELSAFNVKEIANNLDMFFLAEKLRYHCTILSWRNIIRHDIELLFIDDIIKQVEKIDYESIPPIAIYYQIYLTLIDSENEDNFFKLKESISKYIDNFPLDEAKGIYEAAFSYCIKKVNQGSAQFVEQLLMLYEDSLHKEVLFEANNLSPSNFRNICFIGLRSGKFEWTKAFIEQYKEKIHPDLRENAVNFNLARLYFYQKDFEKTIIQLREVDFNDIFYDLGSKVLLLASYYEMDEIDPLYALFDSFGAFLNRHKTTIPEQRRSNYSNLIKLTRKLTKLQPNDKKGIGKLKNEVGDTKNVASKEWLIEKIDALA